TGRQRDDYDIYAPIIEGIRAKADAIVYPTLPITGSGYAGELRSAEERYMHLERLARNGLAEWGVVDPGSALFTRFDQIARGEAGYTYFNPESIFARACASQPSMACVRAMPFTRPDARGLARPRPRRCPRCRRPSTVSCSHRNSASASRRRNAFSMRISLCLRRSRPARRGWSPASASTFAH